MDLVTVDFTSYENAITKALDVIRAHERFAAQKAILIKPNLINTSPHPVTTPPTCCEAIIRYTRKYSKAEIVLAEGCGEADTETAEVFQTLGYAAMAEKYGIPLVDLNYDLP